MSIQALPAPGTARRLLPWPGAAAPRWRALAAMASVLLLLAACGGAEDRNGATPTRARAAAAATAAESPLAAAAVPAPRPAYGPFAFVNHESPQVHPLEQTPDGRTLLAVNTAEGSLMIFDATAQVPQLRATLMLGLDPVTVRARSDDEAWVLHRVSGTASVVDLRRAEVVATFDLCHEPGDLVFAGAPSKAVISCTRPNRLLVLDAATRQALRSVTVAGEGPRALARSADGATVYAAIFESGTPTTVLVGDTADGRIHNVTQDPAGPWGGVTPVPNAGAAYDPPMNPDNPPPPPVSAIVRKSGDGFFTGSVRCTRDVFGEPAPGATNHRCWTEDPQTRARTLCAREGGVCRFDGRRRVVFGDGRFFSSGAWRDDSGGDWTAIVTGRDAALSNRVAGWDLPDRDVAILDVASGRVDYQTRLMSAVMAIAVHPTSGKVYAVGTDLLNHLRFEPVLNGRFLRVNLAAFQPGRAAEVVDLNPHLRYDGPSAPPEDRVRSIGDPRAIVWTADGSRAYVAGMGSNNLVAIDASGRRLATIPVGEGPTGLVLDEPRSRLYVLNRFGASITVLGLPDHATLATLPLFDPTPAAIRAGRRFLYDTQLGSGAGHVACASCHIDGRSDRLAWDLGDPAGAMSSRAGFVFHPMKGPMKTQTLQNIVGSPAMHHRGDRADLFGFADSFQTLLGREQPMDPASMGAFEAFLARLAFPPNPHRTLEDGFSSAVAVPGPAGSVEAHADARLGKATFDGGCVGCHVGSRGRSDTLGPNVLHLSQPSAAETLQGFYERMGLFWKSTDGSTAGTGTRTNGAHDSTLENEGSLTFTRTVRAFFLSFEGPRAELADDRSANAHAAVGFQTALGRVAAAGRLDPGTECAPEGGHCSFGGTREVVYGTSGHWRSGVFTGGTDCLGALFGQPADGITRQCRVVGGPLRRCAAETEVCVAEGVNEVLYGAVSAEGVAGFAKKLVRHSVRCENGVFGDPLPNTVKACHVRTADESGRLALMRTLADSGRVGWVYTMTRRGASRGGYYLGRGLFQSDRLGETTGLRELYAAVDDGWQVTLTLVPRGSEVRIGVDADLDGRLNADERAAGTDPRSAAPSAWRRCADEGGVCRFQGTRMVRYGAGGADEAYAYGVRAGPVTCSASGFGDPAPGRAKVCDLAP